MENQNNQTPTSVQPTAPVTNPEPVPASGNPSTNSVPPAPAQNNINNLKDKFNSMPPEKKRLVIIVGGALAVAIISLILAGILKSSRPAAPVYTPTPSPASSTPFPQSNIDRPSIYATDSAVLKLEELINERSKAIDGMDMEESQLRAPDINFKVDFGD